MEKLWMNCKDIFIRGYFFYNNELYRDKKAIEFLNENRAKLTFMLKDFNGCFSIVIYEKDKVLMAVDRLRSYPIFYTIEGKDIKFNHCTKNLKKEKELTFDRFALQEFKASVLWVSGNRTFYKEIKQVQAGEFVIFSRETGKVSNRFYYTLDYGNYFLDKKNMKESFDTTYDKVGKHLVELLDNRTAIIPLSGGADSRMVLDLLKKENYKKVICYTYGNSKSKEANISRRVAESRGYPWICIDYTKKMWKNFTKSGEFLQYAEYAGNHSSLPHIQDYLAIKEMKKRNLIPSNSVFVPGHSGDMIAGSHITEEFLKEKMYGEEFVEGFIKKFYYGKKTSNTVNNIKKIIGIKENKEYSSKKLLSKSENFNIRERQGKFIVNSVRAYEYFGYDWLIPLWDSELFDYWRRVPINERYKRKLYFECVKKETIKSTNNRTIFLAIHKEITKYPIIKDILRKLWKIQEYFTCQFKWWQGIGFRAFIRYLFTSNDYFNINNFFCDIYIDSVKSEHNKKIKL